jgi:hypothetical protein
VSPNWVRVVAIAGFLLVTVLTVESRTSWLGTAVGRDWATRRSLPCPGITGALNAYPLFVFDSEKLGQTKDGAIVLIGDSTTAGAAGCGTVALAESENVDSAIERALPGRSVANLSVWAGDWVILSRQTALVARAQKDQPARRTWVVLASLPFPTGHDHSLLFSQLCHHASCGAACRRLCREEGEERGGGYWTLFRFFSSLGDPIADLASFVQTFVTAAPATQRLMPEASLLAASTLRPERELAQIYSRRSRDDADPAARAARIAHDKSRFAKASELLHGGWGADSPLQLWYREWLLQLRGLDGKLVVVTQALNPAYRAAVPLERQRELDEIAGWMNDETARILPGASRVKLVLAEDDYLDAVHWSRSGVARASAEIVEAIR